MILLTASGSYFIAKYTSLFQSGDDGTVAKWSVTSSSSSATTLNIVSGNATGTYTLDVTSTSEVSASYSIVLANVPSGIEVKVDNGAYHSPDGTGTIEFSNVGAFTPNLSNSTHSHTLTFNSLLDAGTPASNTIDIDVIFTQTD